MARLPSPTQDSPTQRSRRQDNPAQDSPTPGLPSAPLPAARPLSSAAFGRVASHCQLGMQLARVMLALAVVPASSAAPPYLGPGPPGRETSPDSSLAAPALAGPALCARPCVSPCARPRVAAARAARARAHARARGLRTSAPGGPPCTVRLSGHRYPVPFPEGPAVPRSRSLGPGLARGAERASPGSTRGRRGDPVFRGGDELEEGWW